MDLAGLVAVKIRADLDLETGFGEARAQAKRLDRDLAASFTSVEGSVDRMAQRSVASAKTMRAANDSVSGSVDAMADRLRRVESIMDRINRSTGIRPANDLTARAQDIQAYGDQLDRLRARFNPLYSEIARYRGVQSELRQAHAVGAISLNEMTAAMNRERTASLASIAALKGRSVALREVSVAEGVAERAAAARTDRSGQFRRQNLMYQLFDVAQTGLNPLTAMQQGPQILQLYAGSGGVNAALTDTVSLFGSAARSMLPVSIAAGVVALAIGSIQSEVEKLSGKTISYGSTAKQVFGLIVSDLKALLQPLVDDILPPMMYVFDKLKGASVDLAEWTINAFRAAYADIVFLWNQLPNIVGAAVTGGLNAMVTGIGSLIETASDKLDAWIETVNRGLAILNDATGTNWQIPTVGFDAADNTVPNGYYDKLAKANEEHRKKVEGILGSNPLRDYGASIADRIAGNNAFSLPDGTNGAIPVPKFRGVDDQPGSVDFYRDLIETNKQRLQQLRDETALLGLTGAAAATLRFQQEALAQATEQNIELNPKQLSDLKAMAEQYGQAAEAASRLRLQQDLAFDRDQLYRSPLDRDVASTLKQYDLPVDLNSADAAAVRHSLSVEKIASAWEKVRDTGMDAIDKLVDSSLTGFQNIEDIGKDILNDVLKDVVELGVKNPLKNAIYNKGLPTMSDLGGPLGFIKTLFGGAMPGADGQTVGAMTVTAGSVIVNGGLGGASGNPLADGVSRLFSPANDNANYAPGAVTRAPLADIQTAATAGAGAALRTVGNFKDGVDGRLMDILGTASKRFGGYQVDAVSGFRAGDPRFHGQGLAADVSLTDLVSGKALGNYQNASTFRTYEQFAQVAKQVQMEKYPDLANDFRWGGYFGGAKGKYGAMDSMHFDLAGKGMAGGSWESGLTTAQRSRFPGVESYGMTASATKASSALNGVADKALDATDGLQGFGGGLDKLSQALMSVGGGAEGTGGGWFTGLSRLFGGAGGATAWMNSISPAATNAIASGNWGLYDTGGWTGAGNPKDPAGIVHKNEYVFDAYSTARIGVGTLERLRRAPGYDTGGFVGSRPAGLSSHIPWVGRPIGGRDMPNPQAGKVELHFHNSQQPVERQEEEDDGQGGKKVNVIFGEMWTAEAKRKGSPVNKQLGAMGARMPRPRR